MYLDAQEEREKRADMEARKARVNRIFRRGRK